MDNGIDMGYAICDLWMIVFYLNIFRVSVTKYYLLVLCIVSFLEAIWILE